MSAVEKDSVITLIESEIAEVRAQKENSGWTIWILLSAISAISWLLIGELEKAKYIVINVHLVVTLVFFGFTFVSLVGTLLSSRGDSSGVKFVKTSSVMSKNIFGILLFYTIIILLMYMTYRVHGMSLHISVIAPYIVLAFLLLSLTVMLLASRIDLILPKDLVDQGYVKIQSGKLSVTRFLVTSFLFAFVSMSFYSLTKKAIDAFSSLTFDDMKLAGLVLAVFILLIVLSKTKTKNPLLAELVNIRRNLLLGDISTESAKKQCRIALAGMQLSDIFSGDVNEMIRSISRYDLELNQAQEKVRLFNKNESESVTLSLQQQAALNVTSELVTKYLESAASIMLDDVMKRKASINRRVNRYSKFITSRNEVEWLADINESIYNRVDEYNSLVFTSFNDIQRSIGKEAAQKMITSLNLLDGINFDLDTAKTK